MDLQGFARPMLLSILMMAGCAGNGAAPVPEMPSQGAAVPLPDGHDGGAQEWVALSADNRSDGILRLVGEIADRTVTFSADTPEGEIVERWSCDGDRCRWVRSVHLDGRLVARVTADLEREVKDND